MGRPNLLDGLERLNEYARGYLSLGDRRCRPARRVDDHALDIAIVERWKGLMTGPEVKDAAVPACEATAAPEYLATLEPAHQDKLVGRWDIEELAVGFLLLKLKMRRQSRGNRMIRSNNPNSLPLSIDPPI